MKLYCQEVCDILPSASRKWQCREVWLYFSTINLVERGLVTGKAYIYSTGALLVKLVLGVLYLSFFLQTEGKSLSIERTLGNQLRVVLKAGRRTCQIVPSSCSGFAYVSHLAEVSWLAQGSNVCHFNLVTTLLLNVFPNVLNCHSASVWIRKTLAQTILLLLHHAKVSACQDLNSQTEPEFGD